MEIVDFLKGKVAVQGQEVFIPVHRLVHQALAALRIFSMGKNAAVVSFLQEKAVQQNLEVFLPIQQRVHHRTHLIKKFAVWQNINLFCHTVLIT